MARFFAAAFTGGMVACAAAAQVGFGGGPADTPAARVECIPPAERLFASAAAEGFMRAHPELMSPGIDGVNLKRYRFMPQGGRTRRDLHINNYVDMDPGPGILDWDCTDYTYNGHLGYDVDLRSFAEQGPAMSPEGVPIFAALPGVVAFRADGNPDMNTFCTGQGNAVILDHGNGQRSWYWHMKRGSVTVNQGDHVVAGQQLGLTASSGCSTGPHLHFETQITSVPREPAYGPCHVSQPSLWSDPKPVSRSFYLRDCGVTWQNMNGFSLPSTLPRGPQIALTDSTAYVWVMAANLPAASTWRLRLVRPNGTIAGDTGTGTFGGNPFYRWSWWWWNWPVSSFGGLTGTWAFRLDINGVTTLEAPFEVVATRDPLFNRAPAPVTVSFSPAAPQPGDVVFCDVSASLTLDDPDYDAVKFRYRWTVDGVEARNVVSYGHSDALRQGLAGVGQTIRCVVTPMDATLAAAPAEASAVVVSHCAGDSNGDRVVDFVDLNFVLSQFGQFVGTQALAGDLNDDGFVDFTDLNLVLGGFGAAC